MPDEIDRSPSSVILATVMRHRRRLVLVLLVRSACYGAAAVVLPWLVLDRVTGLSLSVMSFGAALAVIAIAGTVTAARAPDLRRTSRLIDSRLGLKDRVTAAVQLGDGDNPLAPLIVQDAVRKLEGISPSRVFPWHLRRPASILSTALLLSIAASWVLERGPVSSDDGHQERGRAAAGAGSRGAAGRADNPPERSESVSDRTMATASAGPPAPQPGRATANAGTAPAPGTAEKSAPRESDTPPATVDSPGANAIRSSDGTLRRQSESGSLASRQSTTAVRAPGAPAPGSAAGGVSDTGRQGAPLPGRAGRGAPNEARGRTTPGSGGVAGGQLSQSTANGALPSAMGLDVRQRAARLAETATTREDLPPRLRAYLRSYFTAIGAADPDALQPETAGVLTR